MQKTALDTNTYIAKHALTDSLEYFVLCHVKARTSLHALEQMSHNDRTSASLHTLFLILCLWTTISCISLMLSFSMSQILLLTLCNLRCWEAGYETSLVCWFWEKYVTSLCIIIVAISAQYNMYATALGSSAAFHVMYSSYEGVFPRSLHFFPWYNDYREDIQWPERTCSLRVSPHSIVMRVNVDYDRVQGGSYRARCQ